MKIKIIIFSLVVIAGLHGFLHGSELGVGPGVKVVNDVVTKLRGLQGNLNNPIVVYGGYNHNFSQNLFDKRKELNKGLYSKGWDAINVLTLSDIGPTMSINMINDTMNCGAIEKLSNDIDGFVSRNPNMRFIICIPLLNAELKTSKEIYKNCVIDKWQKNQNINLIFLIGDNCKEFDHTILTDPIIIKASAFYYWLIGGGVIISLAVVLGLLYYGKFAR